MIRAAVIVCAFRHGNEVSGCTLVGYIEYLVGINGTLVKEKFLVVNPRLAAILLVIEFLEHSRYTL